MFNKEILIIFLNLAEYCEHIVIASAILKVL